MCGRGDSAARGIVSVSLGLVSKTIAAHGTEVGKYVRDARVLTLYEGTSQVQKLIIGRDLTGVNAMT